LDFGNPDRLFAAPLVAHEQANSRRVGAPQFFRPMFKRLNQILQFPIRFLSLLDRLPYGSHSLGRSTRENSRLPPRQSVSEITQLLSLA
jgi:hypothetical protein